MTIHRTLLLSYLLISLASALLIALMIFAHFRDVLRQEIEGKLESQAITIMQQIDTTLFERTQNMASWSHSDIMQEIRVQDVDKRLSQFLYELYAEYDGMYQTLFVINQKKQIIASSHPESIGTVLSMNEPWLITSLKQHTLNFAPLSSSGYWDVSIPIEDAFHQIPLGRLYARFNWQEIIRLLDGLVLEHSTEANYSVLLVDKAGRVIATSSNLDAKISPFVKLDNGFFKEQDSGVLLHYAEFLQQDVLVGYSNSQGYRAYKGLGWRILVLQSSDSALNPILNVWYVLLLFLCLTLSLGVVVSLWMSAKISKPITQLAKSTHDFMAGNPTQFDPIKASTEISELNSQFAEMISSLEKSRLDVARVAKLAVIGEMAASMAHEVRTPLGVLRSSAQILQKEPQLSEIGLEMTEFILSETQRLNGLVTTMLECARPRAPAFYLHDVAPIIEHVNELLKNKAEAKHIGLALQYEGVATQIYCDKDQLIQVFLNLIMNAIQHTAELGHVITKIHADSDFLAMIVCDDGVGIAEDQKLAVFDPFYTRRDEGIGLGLTVVQQIIIAHHGHVFITDNKPRGTCFHVQLPIKNYQEQNK